MKKLILVIISTLIYSVSYSQIYPSGTQNGNVLIKNFGKNYFVREKIQNQSTKGYAGIVFISDQDTAFMQVDSVGRFDISNFVTDSIGFRGSIDKGLNFANATPSFTDADNAYIGIGTWNDPIDITGQTEHFVPLQINLRSGSTIAKDIAAARFRVNTVAVGGTANTLTNVNVLEMRSKLEVNTGSAANLQVSTEVSENITNTGDLLVGYFSLQGDGNITCGNHVNVLEATNTHTGTGVKNVAHFTENGTGGTITNVLKVENIAGTTTNLAAFVNTGGTTTNGINISGTLTKDIVLQNGESIDNATNGVTNFGTTNLIAATYNFADTTVVGGTADAITINFTPDLPALSRGLKVTFIADAANTGATTVAIDGGTAKAILEYGGAESALEANDIRAGQIVEMIYNGTAWVMISQSGN